MSRKTVQIDRSCQFDLLEERPASSIEKQLNVAVSGRKFNAPDCQEIFLRMTRLDRYLEQAGLTAPISTARLLDA